MYIRKNLDKLGPVVPIIGVKLWNKVPGRMRDTSKKCLNKNESVGSLKYGKIKIITLMQP